MKQVLIKAGAATVADVPAPQVGPKNILVRVEYSCISVGTEMASVKMSSLPLYKRALQQPENVKKVFSAVKEQGLMKTIQRVQGKLSAGSATGYSAAGIVIEVGCEVQGFRPGDRVACAGAGIANHAEVIDVPVNLAVRIPETLDALKASTVTLGAIALQGVRRMNPTLGESIVVVGLGILGQMTVQMLKANGCRVIGVDINQDRIQAALEKGMDHGINPKGSYADEIVRLTDGFGADGILITAAAKSDDIIHHAFEACRKKGRVVLVGDVGLNLERADFYKKEIDFLISCSYGPGRYDATYEEDGQDYPLPYVRWTENRNMEAYLHLVASGQVNLDGFYGDPFSIQDAEAAFKALDQGGKSPLAVFLKYPDSTTALQRKIVNTTKALPQDKIRVGFAGVGGFAQAIHLPNMAKMNDDYAIRAIMSRTGSNARAVAMQYEASYSTTDYAELLKDPEIDLIVISTRHDLHGPMVLAALKAGKNVFVEKPLAIREDELLQIEAFMASAAHPPLLMTGFNRRFAPSLQMLKGLLTKRSTPLMINYRMNAGFIPLDHWVHGAEGGGRNIGEGCHIYDLFNFLVDAEIDSIQGMGITPQSAQWAKNDNFVATFRYKDGSVCTLTYTALGDKSYPKERMDVFVEGAVYSMDDFKSLSTSKTSQPLWSAKAVQKGLVEEAEAISQCLRKQGKWPISLADQVQATRMSFEVERQVMSS